MIDSNPANRAPRNISTLKAGDKTHHVVCATGCLPIVKRLSVMKNRYHAQSHVAIFFLANVEVTGDPLWAACGAGMFVI